MMTLGTLLSSNLHADNCIHLETLGNAIVAKAETENSDSIERAKQGFFSAVEQAFAFQQPSQEKKKSLLNLAYMIDSSCQWLSPLLKKAWFVSTSDALHSLFVSLPLTGSGEGVIIAQRYRQIVSISQVKELLELSYANLLQIVMKVVEIHRIGATDNYIKKSDNFPKTLVVNGKTKDVYILCSYNVGRKITFSTERKIRTVLCLPFDMTHKAYPLCQSTTKDEASFFSQEKDIRERLEGKVGIWPMNLMLEYTKKGNIQKLTTFSLWGTCDLEAMPQRWCTLYNQIKIAYHLILGLYSMHKESIVHGDIKKRNALVTINNDTVLSAGFIDFGFSFFYPLREEDESISILEDGYYGTIWCTPPEKWGKKVTSLEGEDYFAMDVWALGFLLWQLYFEKTPSWIHTIDSYYRKNLAVSDEARNRVVLEIEKTIEAPLKALARAIGVKELYLKLIYTLMRLDPKERFTAEQAVTAIKEIHSRIEEVKEL